MIDMTQLTHAQLVRIALAARDLVRGSRDSDAAGFRLHRGTDEWDLMIALDGGSPAGGRPQTKRGRRRDPAVQAQKSEALRLVAEGMNGADAARACGVSAMTVYRWLDAERVQKERTG